VKPFVENYEPGEIFAKKGALVAEIFGGGAIHHSNRNAATVRKRLQVS